MDGLGGNSLSVPLRPQSLLPLHISDFDRRDIANVHIASSLIIREGYVIKEG